MHPSLTAEPSGHPTRERHRTRKAIGLSIAYVVCMVIATLAAIHLGVAPDELHEWGDWLAGAASPLAFGWLVVGYFQQGEELRQNTEALQLQAQTLKLQVDELKHSVEEQQNMARATIRHARSAELALLMQFQPDIQCAPAQAVQMWPGDGTRKAVELVLINQGRAAQQCSILSLPNGREVTIVGGVPETWEPEDEGHRISFAYSGGLNVSFQFSVVYTDGFGFPQQSTFQVHIKPILEHEGHVSIGVRKLPVRPKLIAVRGRKKRDNHASE